MTARSVTAPPSLLRAAAGLGRRSLTSRLRRSAPFRILVGGPSPTRILAKPPLILEGDGRIAGDLYRGNFTLAGVTVDVGTQGPFSTLPPTRQWLEALVAFEWLRHLSADGGAIASAQARASVADWIELQGRRHEIAWRADLVARRMTAWLTCADLVMRGAGQDFFDLFITSLGRQLRFLAAAVDSIPRPQGRLAARVALLQATLSLDDCDRLAERAAAQLCVDIAAQILPDGGHVDRNPRTLIALLPAFIRLRETYGLRDLEAPATLISAIDRMVPMLRMLLHGDGRPALFNGATATSAADIAAILAADSTRGRALTNARHSGYNRVAHGSTTLIVDTGMPAPRGYSAEAHAGCLSFELSHGRHRLVVNCGAASDDDAVWARAARSTAAHSTVTLGDSSSGQVREDWVTRTLFGGPVLSGPRAVETEREDARGGTIVEACHDGYDRRFGLIHSRRLYLSEDGNDLRGEDSFTRSGRRKLLGTVPAPYFSVRFHLHPSVRATLSRDGDTVFLLMANHVGWRFTAAGGAVSLEESVYLGDGGEPRRARQIVVHGTASEAAVVKWALKRQSRGPGAKGDPATDAPTLPFDG